MQDFKFLWTTEGVYFGNVGTCNKFLKNKSQLYKKKMKKERIDQEHLLPYSGQISTS